jgi:hypothetical protein
MSQSSIFAAPAITTGRQLFWVPIWVLLATLFLGLGCSPKSKRIEDDGGPSADGDGGDPLPEQLPGGYAPRIRCGNLGQSCKTASACGGSLVCADGMCMPKQDGEPCGDCPVNKFCVLGTCVGADQLGCVCLSAHGRENVPQCVSITALPDACTMQDGLCDIKPEACCTGTACLQGKDDKGRALLGLCEQSCKANEDCDSGCCLENSSVGGKYCAPHNQCLTRCRVQHEECDGNVRPCCDGLLCVTSASDPALNGCQPVCTKDSQCDTKCCVLFSLPDGGMRDDGVCAPSDRCTQP